MSYNEIYSSIETTLSNEFGADAFQLPNKIIDVSNRTWFARVTHLPIEPSVLTLGTNGTNLRSGITQVDVFTKIGTGQPTQSDIIVSLFTRTTTFALADGNVFRTMAHRDSGNVVDDTLWQDRIIIRWDSETLF